MPMNTRPVTGELDGLLAFLDHQRQAVRYACFGLTDKQARVAPAASPLSLGGLVKHLAWGERTWLARIEGHPLPGDTDPSAAFADYMGTFQLTAAETLVGVLADYATAAADTDRGARAADGLDRKVPLPATPWTPDDATVRWILLHLIEETARHAGHADLLREALDGGLSGPLMAAAEGWPADGWVTPWRPALSGRRSPPAGDRLRACPIPV
ncbi:MAG: DinB family protein [Streptosporangiaceae bacterium]